MSRQRLKKGERKQINWDNLVSDLIDNCDNYHQQYYDNKKFTGPSYHFHLRALTASESEKPEMTYAMLVSWGMHRMGGGAQMNDYKTFADSVTATLDDIQKFKTKKLEDISENEMIQLKTIFDTLNPMHSNKKVVAVSKILAHYLPNLIAPIDNEYTFQFIGEEPGKINSPRNWTEFELFKDIHLKLFKPVVADNSFKLKATKWLNITDFPWDTSFPKIVDNLIIGKIRHLKDTDSNYKKKRKKNAL